MWRTSASASASLHIDWRHPRLNSNTQQPQTTLHTLLTAFIMAPKRKRETVANAPISDAPARTSTPRSTKKARLSEASASEVKNTTAKSFSSTKSARDTPSSAPESKPQVQRPCHLLNLPAELRNLIYSKILEDFPACLHPRNNGRLVCASRLLGTNQQIRNELLSELYLTAPIYAQVYDWKFSHIVAFLNKLSTSELKTLPQKVYHGEEPAKVIGREMVLELVLSTLSRDEQSVLRSSALDRAPDLEKWIRRMERKEKRRLTTDVRYKVTCTDVDRFRNLVTLRSWESYLGDLRSTMYEGTSRGRQEVTAIRVAVLEENKAILEKILDALQNGG
ncbi:hypothetical protein AC579_7341 [Pseudocercospora musae]|uniref:F-box domain-containing protein n=1 Tax=Pseudocercospora musae TaxID=113226 RepID=A0A139ICK8_9PEZI|nr:hypothetical protein AC579_7341 [Pseudocercospora musae]